MEEIRKAKTFYDALAAMQVFKPSPSEVLSWFVQGAASNSSGNAFGAKGGTKSGSSAWTWTKEAAAESHTCGYDAGEAKAEVLHRPGGLPAAIEGRRDGSLARVVFYEDGRLHRLAGPAILSFAAAGFVDGVFHHVGGLLHSTSGPASLQVLYFSTPIIRVKFCIHGEKLEEYDLPLKGDSIKLSQIMLQKIFLPPLS